MESKVDGFFVRDTLIIIAVQLKKPIVNVSVFCIIIDKFGHWQKIALIILFKVDEFWEIDLCIVFSVLSWLSIYRWKAILNFYLFHKQNLNKNPNFKMKIEYQSLAIELKRWWWCTPLLMMILVGSKAFRITLTG